MYINLCVIELPLKSVHQIGTYTIRLVEDLNNVTNEMMITHNSGTSSIVFLDIGLDINFIQLFSVVLKFYISTNEQMTLNATCNNDLFSSVIWEFDASTEPELVISTEVFLTCIKQEHFNNTNIPMMIFQFNESNILQRIMVSAKLIINYYPPEEGIVYLLVPILVSKNIKP